MSDLLAKATQRFTECCINAPRYRVAWLVGPPQQRRTTLLAKQLCTQQGWHYLNYTLTPGYFDQLADTIEQYQPTQLTADIRSWCETCTTPVLVIDDLDAMLATWDRKQRRNWVGLMARQQYLPRGLIIVSHFFTVQHIVDLLPDRDPRYCFQLNGDEYDN
jgi:hypothetical protein